MKNRKGFTLIEIVVSLALLTMCFSVLSYSLSAGYSQYNQSNRYKKSSDKDLSEIQKATISDDSNVTVDSQYTMEAKGKSVKVDLYTYKDPSVSSAPSLSRFEANDSEFKSNAMRFEYYNVDSQTNRQDYIQELDGRKLSSFDDLPGTQFTALKQSNEDWGKWAFIGWSTATDKYNGSWTGQAKLATRENNYQGLITRDNFEEVMEYYRNTKKTPKLYATYTYSRDVGGNQNELVLLYNTDKSIRFAKDQSNIKAIASKAAELIKENGLSIITSDFGTNSAISSTGIEILHFRENGWPVLANKVYYNRGNNNLTNYESGSWSSWPLKNWGDYQYQSFPKIGDGTNYKGGIFSNGFLYKAFNDSIGFDLTKVGNAISYRGNYRNINYGYNNLFFGDAFKTDAQVNGNRVISQSFQHLYSLFMKVDTTNKTVRVWAGQVTSSTTTSAITGYDFTASYA